MDPGLAQTLVAVYLTALMVVLALMGIVGGHNTDKKRSGK